MNVIQMSCRGETTALSVLEAERSYRESAEFNRWPAVWNVPSRMADCDLGPGADPFIQFRQGMWELLLQDPNGTCGWESLLHARATSILGLARAERIPVRVYEEGRLRWNVWAPEKDSCGNIIVAADDGHNESHRSLVCSPVGRKGEYRIVGEIEGLGWWNIDTTAEYLLDTQGAMRRFAFMSRWLGKTLEFPQGLYAAQIDDSWKVVGEPELLALPILPWMNSVQPILEGPQCVFSRKGKLLGLMAAVNASWTREYNQAFFPYLGGPYLKQSSWGCVLQPLFPQGLGIGHGKLIHEGNTWWYAGHYIPIDGPEGWQHRRMCAFPVDMRALLRAPFMPLPELLERGDVPDYLHWGMLTSRLIQVRG